MNYQDAIKACREGHRVARSTWGGAYIYFIKGRDVPLARWHGDEPSENEKAKGSVTILDHFDMFYFDKRIIGWSPTSIERSAEDWEVVA